MSHLATVEIEFNDIETLKKTCEKLGIKHEMVKNFEFYDGSKRSGLALYFDGWRYPVVVSENGSEIYMDDYNGAWGDINDLNQVKQHYGVEMTKKLARRKGYSYQEVKNDDGKIEVRVRVN
ncbi:MAG: hypothetical protein ACOCP8_01420 [archaeon]